MTKLTSDSKFWIDPITMNKWSKDKYSREDAMNLMKGMATSLKCINCHDCRGCNSCVDCFNCIDCFQCNNCQHCIECDNCIDVTKGYRYKLHKPSNPHEVFKPLSYERA